MNLPQAAPTSSHEIPTLHTPRLVVRPLRETDLPAVQRNFRDYETVRYLNAVVPWPYPEDGAATWYRDVVQQAQGTEKWTWAICQKEAPNDLIGVIELFREGRPSHRGFWLDRQHWGKGYMQEASDAVNEFAFTTLGFERLVFDNAVGNTRSARIKEKSNARFLGVYDAKFVDPTVTKIEHWELTKEMWLKTRPGSL